MTIINNGLSGASAAQAALFTASQNVANLQTRGYTRQGLQLTAVPPSLGTKDPGGGVAIGAALRFSDAYKTQQLWRSNTEQGLRSSQQPYLTQLEQVMGDDSSGLSNAVDKFFRALNAAGVDPTSTPLRQQVLSSADSLAQSFNSIYQAAANQGASARQQRDASLPTLNSLTSAIATLNDRIAMAMAQGSNTSALVDERDRVTDDLAEQVGIDVLDQADGTRSVTLQSSGAPLVLRGTAGTFTLDTSGSTPVLQVRLGVTSFTLNQSTLGGRVGGLGAVQDDILQPMQDTLLTFGHQLADLINAQLALGYDMQGGTPGKDLFVKNNGGTAGVLQVATNLAPTDLAFSGDGTQGDNSNLQSLIALRTQSVNLGTALGNVLVGDADSQIVGKLAIDSQRNQSLLQTALTIRQQAQDDWDSTSSVNGDEEAAQMMQFQAMYQANLKAISVANSVFDATLEMFVN